MNRLLLLVSLPLVVVALISSGCEQPRAKKTNPAPAPSTQSTATVEPAVTEDPALAVVPAPALEPAPAVVLDPAVASNPFAPNPTEPSGNASITPELNAPDVPTETVKAEAGVAQQGRSLDEYEGVLVTPAKAFFTVREKVVFQIQIPQALQFYKAEHGAGPKSHDEFMEKVIAPNQIKLPELPQGHKYQFNVDNEELEVVRPAKK